MNRKGFTLIELLVVIAIIALLLAILMPSLNIAKRKAQGLICLTNLNTLSKSWYMYTMDNDSLVPSPDTPVDPSPRSSWACRPQTESGVDKAGNANLEEMFFGIKRGVLYPYVESPKVYHCIGDKRSSKPALKANGLGGYRSYSMPGSMTNPIKKQTQIVSPDCMYVFIEEMDGRGYNMNSWIINTTSQKWIDPISIWHGKSSTLGFADGHAESHKWYGKGTIEMAENQTFYYTPTSPEEIADFLFMQKGYPHKRQ
ncbi:MAG: prepilin-type N-terminal cleavage/methylation domain-containing protein [Phycisphaerae bacterium]|nr:prepilin-type N-terminal cleavage/methylation domain-containing protein [Phycisphaerae bacterium]